MNSAKAIIAKNLVLIGILVITILTFLNHTFRLKTLFMLQCGLGAVYILFSYVEHTNSAFRSLLPRERFAYYPGSFFMFRVIKIGLFLMFGFVLAALPSAIMILYPICFIIALAEILVGVIKYTSRLNFVSVDANYVLIGREQIEKIFASELERAEYRHDIIYLVKKDKKTSVIKVFSVKEHDAFLKKMRDWITGNGIAISNESMERLKQQTT